LPASSESLDDQVRSVNSCCPGYIKAARETAQSETAAGDRALRALADLIAPLELELGDDLNDLLDSLAERREELHTTLVQAESAMELVREKIVKRSELEKEITDDTTRCARYKTLAAELRQDHFIGFVLAESMERLAALASIELLRISGDRYSLEADKGNFDVIDHQNADERRSVATLSGGETFLASLALALALAGSVRDLAGTAAASRLDAIFIDEGFGALDPETLDVVLDALERLGEGERMVGVISHVGELAQRIPQGLVVTKNGGVSTVTAR
jgi:exonuclease SbcC